MIPAAPSQVTGVDEITRQEDANVSRSSPVVVVSSVYVPSARAVHVPVTASDPAIGANRQPVPTNCKSSSPPTLKQDSVTVQVPTISPPQGVPFAQEPPAPPTPLLPPAPPIAPERPPPPPDGAPEAPPFVDVPGLVVLHPPTTSSNAAIVTTGSSLVSQRVLAKVGVVAGDLLAMTMPAKVGPAVKLLLGLSRGRESCE